MQQRNDCTVRSGDERRTEQRRTLLRVGAHDTNFRNGCLVPDFDDDVDVGWRLAARPGKSQEQRQKRVDRSARNRSSGIRDGEQSASDATEKRSGDAIPDTGVDVNEMKQMMEDPALKMYFEECIRHVQEGLRTGKYQDETSAYAALVQEMDIHFAQDPDLANKKRCLSAAMAYVGLGSTSQFHSM